jgi:AraC family transcriptional regulator, transcriptional activator of pobA
MENQPIPTIEFVDEVDTPLPFSIQKIKGMNNIGRHKEPEQHRHNFNILTFLRSAKGSGVHIIDFVKYRPEPYSVHIIRPNQVHSFESIHIKQIDAINVSFPKEFIYPSQPLILEDSENINKIKVQKKDFDYFYELLDRIYDEFQSKNKWRSDMIINYLTIILTSLSRIYLSRQPEKTIRTPEATLLIKYKNLVNENYLNFRQVSDYANMLFISPGHLNDKIKEQTGITAKELINERIILESKRLLFFNDLNIKEIADNLRFKDIAYFTRFFKIQTGQTPQEFRLQSREIYK